MLTLPDVSYSNCLDRTQQTFRLTFHFSDVFVFGHPQSAQLAGAVAVAAATAVCNRENEWY